MLIMKLSLQVRCDKKQVKCNVYNMLLSSMAQVLVNNTHRCVITSVIFNLWA